MGGGAARRGWGRGRNGARTQRLSFPCSSRTRFEVVWSRQYGRSADLFLAKNYSGHADDKRRGLDRIGGQDRFGLRWMCLRHLQTNTSPQRSPSARAQILQKQRARLDAPLIVQLQCSSSLLSEHAQCCLHDHWNRSPSLTKSVGVDPRPMQPQSSHIHEVPGMAS